MKKILLGTAALLTTAGMAVAADMPVKAPILKAPPPVVMLWDNVYVGAEGGYGWSSQEWGQIYSSCFIGPPLPVGCAPILDRTTGAADVKGVLGGGLFGFNRQMASWVFGLEFNWDGADLKGTRGHVLAPAFSSTSKIDWMATFTGRVGFLVSDRTLLFGKGGFAIVDENHVINNLGVATASRDDGTRLGWVIGAGIEHMFTGSLSAKLEYNYLGFRGQNYGFTFNNGQALAGLFEGWRINEQTHLFKAGLNWHFMPTPVVARY